MKFGTPRNTSPTEDTVEFFIEELENELLLIQIYLYDMDSFLRNKKDSITKELKDEEKEIRIEILKQPNYKLYDSKFNDLLTKNIFVTLISRFEVSLDELIKMLKREKVIKNKIPKYRDNIVLKLISFLESELKLEKTYINNLQLFILFRNRIIHSNSKVNDKIINHNNFGIIKDHIILEKDFFYFKDIGINLFLLKEIRTFFNSLYSQISKNTR